MGELRVAERGVDEASCADEQLSYGSPACSVVNHLDRSTLCTFCAVPTCCGDVPFVPCCWTLMFVIMTATTAVILLTRAHTQAVAMALLLDAEVTVVDVSQGG